jgi:DNA-binding transcriptional LysR family regulator
MEIRELQALIAIAEERHFTRAANRLHVAQPALSQQLRRLESKLGLKLVDRKSRNVQLTDADSVMLLRARRIWWPFPARGCVSGQDTSRL